MNLGEYFTFESIKRDLVHNLATDDMKRERERDVLVTGDGAVDDCAHVCIENDKWQLNDRAGWRSGF